MLSERIKFVKALAPAADRFDTNPTSAYINTKGCKRLTFLVIYKTAGTNTGKATVTVKAASDSSGTGAATQPYTYRRNTTGASDVLAAPAAAAAAGVDTTVNEDAFMEIEVDVDSLPDGKPWVAIQLTEAVNDPVSGCVIAILDGNRFKGLTDMSALS